MHPASARNTHIDRFKSLLMFAMIATHAIAVLGEGGTAAQGLVELAGRLAAYSGFMFCYGAAAQLAYFGRGTTPIRRLLPGVARIRRALRGWSWGLALGAWWWRCWSTRLIFRQDAFRRRCCRL